MRALASILVVSYVLCAAVSVGAAQVSGTGGGVYRPGSGVSAPRVIRTVKPQYTAEAMKAKIQGSVELEFVVLPDGTVGEVKIVRSLHTGLDQEAIKAVKQWQFKPGTKGGEPVAVRVDAELTFTLRDRRTPSNLPAVPASDLPPSGAASETEKAIISKPGDGVSPPRLVHEVKPLYPTAAKASKIQGMVLLDAVVGRDGTVGDIRVIRSLEPELDLEAIKAVKQWRFEPGTKDGKPVPVQVTIELAFTLK